MKLNKLLICELLGNIMNQSDLYHSQEMKDYKSMINDYEEVIKDHMNEQLFREYKELREDAENQIYKQGFMEGIKFINHIIEHFDEFVSED